MGVLKNWREERLRLLWAEQATCPLCGAAPNARCVHEAPNVVKPAHKERVAAAVAAGFGPPRGRPPKVQGGGRIVVRLDECHERELDALHTELDCGGRAGAVRLLIEKSAARRAKRG